MLDWSLVGLDPLKGGRVVVAMSGGVDSSVAAVVLHEAGFEVIGVTLRLYDAPQSKRTGKACCAGVDIYDAASVAQSQGFPHYVFDYADKFKEEVVDDFIESYLRGQTPLPCVRCNQGVKFRDLLSAARDLDADALVTGHYMRRIVNDAGEVHAYRAVDLQKDQSYFLFATTKNQLDMLRFPLGGMHKKDIRQLAKKYGLSVSDKPDSQDICFVGGKKYSDVILQMRPDARVPGLIRCFETGKILGEHEGIYKYTVGQRRGLRLETYGAPLYVIHIDSEKKTVYVGQRHLLKRNYILLKEVNWLGEKCVGGAFDFKVRSVQDAVRGKMVFLSCKTAAIVCLDAGEDAVSVGQACVVYDGMRLMGGGWISDTCLDPGGAEKKDWLKRFFSQ